MDDKSSASPLPPIWVLNLQRSPKRRQFMVNQLKSFDLDFQMVEAVDGWSLSAEELKKYSPEKALRIIGRELACTEVGCALSHIQIYHQMVKENIDELLILEDDVVITQDFLELIKCRHRFPQDYDLINFQTTAIKYPIGEYIYKQYRACKFLVPAESLLSYLVTQRGARKLLQHAYPIRFPADCLTSRTKIADLTVYGVTPLATRLSEFVSDIWGHKAERNQYMKALKRRNWLVRLFLLVRFNWF